jgi:hypothetical protein
MARLLGRLIHPEVFGEAPPADFGPLGPPGAIDAAAGGAR